MTESSHNTFVDRRTERQKTEGLATPILFWYDTDTSLVDGAERRRINGMAVHQDGVLMVARATCSPKDQFIKARGRMIVENRLLGGAKRHCWALETSDGVGDDGVSFTSSDPEAFAAAYEAEFPGDERGVKRAFNAGKIFKSYLSEVQRKANVS